MSAPLRILSVFGTRPEAIKMAPVVNRLARTDGIESSVCVTAQHREMLDSVLAAFAVRPDRDLNVMAPDQGLNDILAAVLRAMEGVFADLRPDRVLVHGDTTTTLAAALAAHHAKIPAAHVEAGLRTGRRYAPFPEELNRRLADDLCDLHFAPTETGRRNLLAEGIAPGGIFVTGNTVIDALLDARGRAAADPAVAASLDGLLGPAETGKRIILVTGHRRENFGAGFEAICRALIRLAERGDVTVVYPVHLNPNVQEPVNRLLGGHANVRLTAPLDYLPFVALMDRADVVITDSGGIQEEAPALGKPVLVMREATERPEAVDAGTVRLVGTDTETIVSACATLLDDSAAYAAMSRAVNPYGDGRAAERIVDALLGKSPDPWSPPAP